MTTGGPSAPRPSRRWLFLAMLLVVGLGVAVALRPDDDERAEPGAPPDEASGVVDVSHAGHGGRHDHVPVVRGTGVTRTTQQSGPWSDPGTWQDEAVPQAGDAVVIAAGHDVTVDTDAAVDGVQVSGSLTFEPGASRSIDTTSSVIVTGRLTMAPDDAEADHRLRFTGVDTSAFTGLRLSEQDDERDLAEIDYRDHLEHLDHNIGDPATDVGLWVLEDGQLHLDGAARTGWTNAVGSIAAGATTIEVVDADGWRVGDEVAIAPTAAPSDYTNPAVTYDGFHETTIAAIDDTTITLADPTTTAHDQVDGRWTAEVMNLTRNVRIEGTDDGQAHVLVHTTGGPQLVRNVALRHLGVPDVLGRYPLHFHHAGDSTRGSLVEGVVVRQGAHHAYVPHVSHGITMRDLVAYDISGGDAYWWDHGDVTNDLLMERVISAKTTDSGFFLGMGWNLVLRDAVAVGIGNRDGNVAGFEWENGANGLWVFEDTLAHNNDNRGIRVWQNSANPQVVDGFVAYHNAGPGIEHGAYTNIYQYRDIELYGNLSGGVILQAVSRTTPDDGIGEPGIEFRDMVIDAGGVATEPHFQIQGSAVPAEQPVVLQDVTFRGQTGGPLVHFQRSSQHQLRCVRCDIDSPDELVRFTEPAAADDTWLELLGRTGSTRYRPVSVDPGAEQLSSASGDELWRAGIDATVPEATGDGTGLKAEYFDDAALRDLRYTTLLSHPIEYYWSDFGSPYPTVDPRDGAGVRLSGQVETGPGQGGRYEFLTVAGGGVRLWVDGKLVIDDPRGAWTEDLTGSIDLEAGRRYDVRMEVYVPGGDDDYFTYALAWTRPDRHREIIPSTQLHPAAGVPSNAPPIAFPVR